jgi:prefoldin subunit 5
MMMNLIDTLKSRIDRLEEEQRETDNVLYELSNSIDAIDRRIDIIAEEYLNKNV